MIAQTKGVYPSWANDKDLINQVLNEIIRQGGRLPYSYVVNPEHNAETRARMKSILERMQNEQLLVRLQPENDVLEIDIHGSRAVQFGYRKYNRIKKWDGLRNTLGRVSFIIFLLVSLAVLLGLAYFLWKLFKG